MTGSRQSWRYAKPLPRRRDARAASRSAPTPSVVGGLLLLLILCVGNPAHAQVGPFAPVRTHVGDPQLRVDLIRPYVVRWNATSITADNSLSDRGYRTEEVVHGDCVRACWRRVLRVFNANGEQTASTVNLIDA